LPCFCHSFGSALFPSVTTDDNLMTELAASVIALMLTIELAVAIACVAAWFELQRASEGRSAKQAHRVAAARTPEPRWPAFAATLPLGNAPWAYCGDDRRPQGRMRHEQRRARDVLVMPFTISAGVCARLNCSVISPFPRNAEGPTPGNGRGTQTAGVASCRLHQRYSAARERDLSLLVWGPRCQAENRATSDSAFPAFF
jgi:hypothetical protein